jgi:hypothetical protein
LSLRSAARLNCCAVSWLNKLIIIKLNKAGAGKSIGENGLGVERFCLPRQNDEHSLGDLPGQLRVVYPPQRR